MSERDERFDAALAEIVASGRDPAEWTVPAEFAGDEEFQRALDEFAEVARQIDAAGRDEIGTLSEVEREVRPDDAARVAALVRDRAASDAPDVPRSARRLSLVAAGALAAGLLVALFLTRDLWSGRGGAVDRGDEPLGLGRVEIVRPVGEVASFDELEWRFVLPPGGYYEVRVYDDSPADGGDGSGARALLPKTSSGRLPTPTWTPETTSAWPDAMRWEVLVKKADGSVVASGSARASRSR